ncbi:serine hydrolase domain-containing protein [Paenisporosarcina sp. NPDC076898]|uniref:serine hydrolase domain-containing protein n=1 Tax=unclassified Paenisporosarcina TaxID=2642018 RepID=UPI003D071A54
MEIREAKTSIEKKLKGLVDTDPNLFNAFFLIHSDKLNIHWNMVHGETDDIPTNADQPYHTASIAKTFTAVIIAMLVEEGKISYSDPIAKYLTEDILKGLHIYKGKDYTKDIRIEHLVRCTSGLPDFYEDKPKQGKSFLDLLLEEPSRYWTPQETIQWTKENLVPRFPPGEKCHYTNTGYNLLGLLIENITSKTYHQVLHEYIFQPLHMNNTYLSQYSEPAEQNKFAVANINLKNNKIRVEDHRSFSSIYAGGQAVSTSDDLLKFMKALVGNQLISKESLSEMMQWNKLWIGVDYGSGLMRVRMLPIIQKYNVWGHLGSIGSFMLYNPIMDVYIIGNFNKTGYVAKSIRFIFNTLRTLSKLKID